MIYATPTVGTAEANALARIEDLRRQLRFYVSEPKRWLGSVRRVLSARAIQGSNSIEGYNVSVEDAIAAIEGEEPEEAAWVDRQAILGYRRAMTYVIQLAGDSYFAYTPALIRSLHFMITEYALDADPGLWRQKPIWVRNDATGAVVYEAPAEAEVPCLVDELAAELSSDSDTPAMIRAAMAHLNLVMIHPFRDGNGRMSRCLQTLVLAREQILAQELCSIEEYLGRNTESYYKILAEVGQGVWRPRGDARAWVRYCLTAHYIQAASILRRIQESETAWMELDNLRQQYRLQERTMAALFDASIGLRIRNASYRAQLRGWMEEISTQVATIDLKAMVRADLLRPVGQKRGTFYVATPRVRALVGELRAQREPIDASRLFSPRETNEPQLPF
ncbi:MAG: Fic family protein [Jatrophihabitantaceae bacterium]